MVYYNIREATTLKRKIIGIVTAALIIGSSVGYAASTSPLIGAKVQGLFSVKTEAGVKVADAVVINGTAYAPVRAISDATGASLSVEGKSIIIGSVAEKSPSIGETTQAEPTSSANPADISKLRERATALEARISALNEAIQQAEVTAADLTTPADQAARKTYIADLNKRIDFAKAELAEVKAALGE